MSGFFERWHRETNTFHMPFGEISITFDDMSSLLHLPIMGQFMIFDSLDNSEALPMMLELLDVQDGPANAEMREARGNVVRLSWLREHYEVCLQKEHWEFTARAYLMHIIGCTILYIKVSHLSRFLICHYFRTLWCVVVMPGE